MKGRRLAVASISAAIYGGSLLSAFGATGSFTHSVASVASGLMPSFSASDGPYGEYGHEGKTTICHNGVTITVADAAVPAHLAHGDHIGACQNSTRGKP